MHRVICLHRTLHKSLVSHRMQTRHCNSWSSQRVRATFIDYFKSRDHTFVPSSSVIPRKDDGSYFVNAGMNQFKPVFLGTMEADSSLANLRRAVNSQKCIRVGGKHNDLDDVGKDTYHHTFFEMLGSWSFADYFKEDACRMAWQLLTDVYRLPADRLYVTYFGGDVKLGLAADEETKHIWLQIGVSPERVLPFGTEDNFWSMGDTGPCGACTEIHYDHLGRGDAASLVNRGSAELVEIWNLVFMQYDRQLDGSLRALPRRHVDTGMGLERLCAVLNGCTSNYDTDLFMPIFKHIQQECKAPPYEMGSSSRDIDVAYRIIADHVRMFTITISDGFLPGRFRDSQKRLRAIMQKTFKVANRTFDAKPGLVASLVPRIVDSLGDAFPELSSNPQQVMEVINATEERYWTTVAQAKTVIQRAVKKYSLQPGQVLSGEQMYEVCEGRFGAAIPVDVLQDLAEDYNIRTDVQDYRRYVIQINEQTGARPQPEALTLDQYDVIQLRQDGVSVTDDSYKYQLSPDSPSLVAMVSAVMTYSGLTSQLIGGEKAAILLDKTNFYAEQGGQVSDTGTIEFGGGAVFRVEDVQVYQKYVLHMGVLESGEIQTGDSATLKPDLVRRTGCTQHHSSTHLLMYALSHVLGDVTQHGSTVYPDRLTFHFSTLKTSALSLKELRSISNIINQQIHDKLPTYIDTVPLSTARNIQGIRMLNQTVYSENVRVVSIGVPVNELLSNPSHPWQQQASVELCGGTHVGNTSELCDFVITSATGGQQGIRSIVAYTGQTARQAIERGAEIRDKLETLKRYVTQNVHSDQWNSIATSIETILGKEQHISKLDRESILSELKSIRSRTNPAKRDKARLLSEIREALDKDDRAVVLYVNYHMRTRDMYDCIVKEKLTVPVLLTVKHKDNFTTVCYVPDTTYNCTQWTDYMTVHIAHCTVNKAAGKHAADVRLRTISIPYSEHNARILTSDTFMNQMREFWTNQPQTDHVS